MFFPPEDAPLVKAWLMKKLPDVSDTETDILADYVLALLASQEGDAAPVRAACESELPQFLNTDAAPKFVDELFRVLEYKSYLPGAPPPPNKRTEPTNESGSGTLVPPTAHPGDAAPSGSRKRSYHERVDAISPSDLEFGLGEEREYKQPRRGQWEAGKVNPRGSGNPVDFSGQLYVAGGFHQAPPGAALYDPHYPQPLPGPQDWLGLSPQVPPYLQGPPYGPLQTPRRKRQRCRDFATKGYCARGSSCQYDHGTESIWVPASGLPKFDDFDPRDAAMLMSQNFQQMQQLMEAINAGRGGRGSRRNGRGGKGQRRQKRASFSAEGPVNDKTKTTIVVESIPDEHLSEEAVRGFFSQFGTIMDVSMKPHKRLAVVKYDTWQAANAAYRSPKVIFDNRFVKVLWYVEDNEQSLAATGANGVDVGSGEEAVAEPEIDMKEFLKKQEEAQKLHEEKMQKKQELEKQREQLEQRQKELLSRHREEQRKLQAKLATSKNGSPGIIEDESGSLNSALRAQLAALEDEAKLLGLDPDATDEPTSWYMSSRGRGRGRGGFPARGRGYADRGRGSHRGGYRGDVHAAYAAYSLDNRPRTVSVSGVDFTSSEKDEALRQYLLGIGEFTDIQTTPTNTQVTFKDRKTAEKFYYGLPKQEIPGIDGQLELSWVPTPHPPVKMSTDNATGRRQGAMDKDMTTGNAVSNGTLAIAMDQQPEMDYDVADDDDDWGVE